MTIPVVALFNNKGGVGKTSLVYHLAWMLAERGHRVVAADFDPQANLAPTTVYGSLLPLLRGVGDVMRPQVREITDDVGLLPGDLRLSAFEDELSSQWPACLDGKERAFRVISAFWRLAMMAAEDWRADLVLVDVGPNLGAINRAALVASDHIVIPLAPDLFSVQGLLNLGPTLRRWRQEWGERVPKNPAGDLDLPSGSMRPEGYVLLQHGVRLGNPVQAYRRWMNRIPGDYQRSVLGERAGDPPPSIESDPHCLAQLRHYRSLMPLAQEARKPVFHLTPADGAFGGHQRAVAQARSDFSQLADEVLRRVGVVG